MISVSLIDNDAKIVDFFRQTTLETSEVVCVKTATTVEEFLKNPPVTKNKHFLFLDIHLEGATSLKSIPTLLEEVPDLEIIVFSVDEEYHQLMNAFKLGASGYIIKRFDKAYLKEFFNILDRGGAAISPKMAKKLINAINLTLTTQAKEKKFTEREINILNYLAEGWTYQYIADKLEVSIDGVRYYIKKIYNKLNVKSRAEAVRVFREL